MKLVAFICIVAGALLIFLVNDKSSADGYLKILGFALLMFGLYRATKFWVQENPKDSQKEEDHDISSKN